MPGCGAAILTRPDTPGRLCAKEQAIIKLSASGRGSGHVLPAETAPNPHTRRFLIITSLAVLTRIKSITLRIASSTWLGPMSSLPASAVQTKGI